MRLTCVRATLSFLALLVAIAGPALLLAFQVFFYFLFAVLELLVLVLLLLYFFGETIIFAIAEHALLFAIQIVHSYQQVITVRSWPIFFLRFYSFFRFISLLLIRI